MIFCKRYNIFHSWKNTCRLHFYKLEGVYIPAQTQDDIAIVGISANRPITRQRFTAAHELCHHFRDADKQVACPIGQKNASEYFADAFASALLMPMGELIFALWIVNFKGENHMILL